MTKRDHLPVLNLQNFDRFPNRNRYGFASPHDFNLLKSELYYSNSPNLLNSDNQLSPSPMLPNSCRVTLNKRQSENIGSYATARGM